MKKREIIRQLRKHDDADLPVGLRQRLMAAIPEGPRDMPRRERWSAWRDRLPALSRPLLVPALGLAALAAFVVIGGRGDPEGHHQLSLVSQAYAAMLHSLEDAGAYRLLLDVRTSGNENFEAIDPDAGFVRVQLEFELPSERFALGRMRIDRENRVKVFDGQVTTLYFPLSNEVGTWMGEAGLRQERLYANPERWLVPPAPSAAVETIVDSSLVQGQMWTTLTWREAGQWQPQPGAEPSFYEQFDRRTVVSWETGTNRLTQLEKYVWHQGDEVLVTRLHSIALLDRLADADLELDLPAVVHRREYADVDNAVWAELGPLAVARLLLSAWQSQSWTEIEAICDSRATIAWMQETTLLDYRIIGAPDGANYAGVKVPCEISTSGSDGRERTRTTLIALRNDNPLERYVLDGGL